VTEKFFADRGMKDGGEIAMRKKEKVELLAPAGSLEKGRLALDFGADAIYLGGKLFGLRAFANNFTLEEMENIASYAHSLGKKVYVTVNIFAHNADLKRLPDYMRGLSHAKVDALLVSDLGVWSLAREIIPDMPLHVSTQANTTNLAAVKMWERLGAQRVVLARELSLKEIAEIGEATDVELEAFVHGAMCISYSGRCWLSSYLTGRDGNRGACAQICRWKFTLHEKKHPNEEFAVEEDERGAYILNSKDLCLLEYLPQLRAAGVCSFKIEGRMKSAHYVATVVSVYRKAIDLLETSPERYVVADSWRRELEKISHRPYTTGFAVKIPDASAQVYTTSSYVQTTDFVAQVLSCDVAAGRLYLEQRNNVKEGEVLEVLQPNGKVTQLPLKLMMDDTGARIVVAPHAQQHFSVACSENILPGSMLRRYNAKSKN